MKKRPFFKHYKKIFVNEFKGYNVSKFIKDVLAGLTVAAVALPLAIAFGAASVPNNQTFGVVAGMITAIVAGIVIGALGGGSFQVSGPTGAMTVILGGIIANYNVQGMFLACFMAGVILLVAGLLRLGKLIQFIPRPVIVGFTTGIALVIALGQFANFFGVDLKEGVEFNYLGIIKADSTIGKIINLFGYKLPTIQGTEITSMIIALIGTVLTCVIIFLFPKKWNQYVPGSLVALIIVTVIAVILNATVTPWQGCFNMIGDGVEGRIINSEILSFGGITFDMVTGLIGPAFTIAALGMIESLLCGVCAAKMKNEKFDSNVELIAQGIGNMVVPFFGGVPATAAIARTSVAIKSGSQTRVTSIMQSVILIICVFALPSVIAVIPKSALAGILFATAWKMNDWKTIKLYFKNKMWEAVILFTVTMVCTVLLDLTYAIVIGVILSFIIMVVNTKLELEFSPIEENGKRNVIVYATGSLFFANAEELQKQVMKIVNDYDRFVFVFRGITYLDVSSIETLTDIVTTLSAEGKTCCFTGVKTRIYQKLEKGGFVQTVGEENFYATIDKLIMTEIKED